MVRNEQFSWIWAGTLIAVLGPYFVFVSVAHAAEREPTFLFQITALAAALLIMAVVAGLSALISRVRHRDRANTQPDERDRLIELRSSKVSYYVLMVGIIIVGCVMPFEASGWDIVNTAVLAIAVAEVTGCLLTVRGYRRGIRV
jgi:drug/metabolite transporter (DMT)-like permease